MTIVVRMMELKDSLISVATMTTAIAQEFVNLPLQEPHPASRPDAVLSVHTITVLIAIAPVVLR